MQAARGASLNPSDTGPVSGELSTPKHVVALRVVGAAAYALDIGTKQWALSALEDRDIKVVGDLLVLHLTHNPGRRSAPAPSSPWR